MIVQQDDVSARDLAQDALGQNRGIRRECITRPNTPRNILKARLLEIGPQKGMAQAHRRAEGARPETTAATNAVRAALDLGAQTPGHEKTEQRRVRPGVVGHQVTFGPGAAHDFRILVRALSQLRRTLPSRLSPGASPVTWACPQGRDRRQKSGPHNPPHLPASDWQPAIGCADETAGRA